jgi:uncharacterized damage-inducible protein DinB
VLREVRSLAHLPPEVGRALWALDDGRRRTKAVIGDLEHDILDWAPPDDGNAISTLLYHIAAIEMEWVCFDVQGRTSFCPEVRRHLAAGVRDEAGRLVRADGESILTHLARLDETRDHLVDVYSAMTAEEFRRPRRGTTDDVTPEWVVHHLLQHEAEHRGQIVRLRVMARVAGATE